MHLSIILLQTFASSIFRCMKGKNDWMRLPLRLKISLCNRRVAQKTLEKVTLCLSRAHFLRAQFSHLLRLLPTKQLKNQTIAIGHRHLTIDNSNN
jgi:hypothetical protein